MCITFLCTDGVERGLNYKLILLNNRDEALDRKTSAAHWEDGYLAGRDEQALERGTWLGITHDGRIGNLLSITEPEHHKLHLPNAPSRGAIASKFLSTTQRASEFCDRLHVEAHRYHGFQFLSLARNSEDKYEIFSLTNRLVDEIKTRHWSAGSYCFGNSPRESPMKKVVYGQEVFDQLVSRQLSRTSTESEIVDSLMKLARDSTEHFPDPQIAIQTCRDDSYNRYLSSIFVQFPSAVRYGTRSHTIVLVDKENRVYFREERMIEIPENVKDAKWETIEERFTLR
ncbi:hypothetical protein M3Y98_01191300 [Aphelenchoides besseyi]|nr:hypothetical protein M3Y98_01191300 [Aphelenchoides besseyi]